MVEGNIQQSPERKNYIKTKQMKTVNSRSSKNQNGSRNIRNYKTMSQGPQSFTVNYFQPRILYVLG